MKQDSSAKKNLFKIILVAAVCVTALIFFIRRPMHESDSQPKTIQQEESQNPKKNNKIFEISPLNPLDNSKKTYDLTLIDVIAGAVSLVCFVLGSIYVFRYYPSFLSAA